MTTKDLTQLARQQTQLAVSALAEIAADIDCKPADRIRAALALLDRGWGKPSVLGKNASEFSLDTNRPTLVLMTVDANGIDKKD